MPHHQPYPNQPASGATQVPRRPPKPYLVLSADGFVELCTSDPFSERIVQLHYEQIVLTLADPSYGGLCEFSDTDIDGHQLLCEPHRLLALVLGTGADRV